MLSLIPRCPFCGAKHNPVRCDTHEQRTHCTCNKCKQPYTRSVLGSNPRMSTQIRQERGEPNGIN